MEPLTVRESSARIDELLDDLEQSAVPAVLERVQELLACVMSLYGAGLERTIDVVLEAGQRDLARRLADDEIVGNLLVLHDLHPDDVLTRVNGALERVRPYLGSHAGGVQLLGVDEEGIVHLQLQGSCDGCPSSALTVASAIEDAILQAAPDVVAVEAEGMVEPSPSLLQIAPFAPHENVSQPADHWHRTRARRASADHASGRTWPRSTCWSPTWTALSSPISTAAPRARTRCPTVCSTATRSPAPAAPRRTTCGWPGGHHWPTCS